jgi:hypothetical protein
MAFSGAMSVSRKERVQVGGVRISPAKLYLTMSQSIDVRPVAFSRSDTNKSEIIHFRNLL